MVKKLFNQKFATIGATSSCIRQVPRLLGPCLGKMANFPRAIKDEDGFYDLMYNARRSVRMSNKLKGIRLEDGEYIYPKVAAISCVIGDTNMSAEMLKENILSLTAVVAKEMNWNKIKKIMIKTTHGKGCCIYKHTDMVAIKELPELVKEYNKKVSKRSMVRQ